MNYFGQWSNLEFVRQDGTMRPAAEVLRTCPYVILFFGASWHAETRNFFPILERFYEKHHELRGFEVVYISRDYNKAEMLHGFLRLERQGRREREEEQQRQALLQKEEEERQQKQVQEEREQASVSSHPTSEAAADAKRRAHGRDDGHKPSDRATTSSPSSPPPLKRVAELRPGKATNSFSNPLGCPATTTHPAGLSMDNDKACTGHLSSSDNSHSSSNSAVVDTLTGPGFWAVPYEHVGTVGVPILYHLRIFSYPGVVVCGNDALSPLVKPLLLPALDSAIAGSAPGSAGELGGVTRRTDAKNAPRRREKTPKIAHPSCVPDVLSITGRFQLETEDPEGENFPWFSLSSATRDAATTFFTIVIVLAAVSVAVLLPMFTAKMHARNYR